MTSKIVFKTPVKPKSPFALKLLPIIGILIGIFIAFRAKKSKSAYIGFGLAGGVLCALPLAVFEVRRNKAPKVKTLDITPISEAKAISSPAPLNTQEESSYLEHGML